MCPSDDPSDGFGEAEGSLHIRNRGFAEYGGSHDIPFSKSGIRCREWGPVPRSGSGGYGLEFEDHTDWDFNDLRIQIEPLPDGDFLATAISKSARRDRPPNPGSPRNLLAADSRSPEPVLISRVGGVR